MQTRRELLRSMGMIGAGLAASKLLTGCTGGGAGPATNGGAVPGPLEIPSGKVTLKGDIAFQGYGDQFWKLAAQGLEKEHPNVTVDLNFAPDVWQSLQPKFATGNVPDIAYPGYQANIEQLALEGVLLPLDKLLDSPAFGSEGATFRDLWLPGSLEYGTWEGKVYALPLAEISWLMWYDKALFEERGWTPPTYWDELLDLCDEIAGAGISPIGNPGAAPGFWNECMHHGLLWKLGGEEFAIAADNLEPGVWKRPEVAEALDLQRQLFERGHVRAETRGLSNIDVQLEWLRGRNAFVPAGTWLENEMRDEIPKDFVFSAMPVPGVRESAGGHPSDVRTWFSELQVIPSDAKQLAAAQEYFRIFFSPEYANKFAEVAKSPMPIEGRYDGVKLTPAMESAQAANENAQQLFDFRHTLWYSKLRAEQPAHLTSFLYGDISSEQYMDAMEDLNKSVREDDSIKKHKRS